MKVLQGFPKSCIHSSKVEGLLNGVNCVGAFLLPNTSAKCMATECNCHKAFVVTNRLTLSIVLLDDLCTHARVVEVDNSTLEKILLEIPGKHHQLFHDTLNAIQHINTLSCVVQAISPNDIRHFNVVEVPPQLL